MKLSYKFNNLCGVIYRQGNILFTNDSRTLISPVGGRVTLFDMEKNENITLPFELDHYVCQMALCPSGNLLIASDHWGNMVMVNIPQRIVLHRFNLFPKKGDESRKKTMGPLAFSPCSNFLSITDSSGLISFYRLGIEGMIKEHAPLSLVGRISITSSITSIQWSKDSRYLLLSSSDMVCRLLDLGSLGTATSYLEGRQEEKKSIIELRAHRHPLVGAFFIEENEGGERLSIATIGKNGSLFHWKIEDGLAHLLAQNSLSMNDSGAKDGDRTSALKFKVSSFSYNEERNLLLIGGYNGVFGLFYVRSLWDKRLSLPSSTSNMVRSSDESFYFEEVYALSLGREERVSTCAISNGSGDWLSFGLEESGQLLIWEWKSESFILKQAGHQAALTTCSFSPSSSTTSNLIATGSQDGTIRLWDGCGSGLCVATLKEHTGPISCVTFSSSGKVLLSSSNDGTLRAWDLVRMRPFRTFTTGTPVQFSSLALDPHSTVVAGATLDTFQIFLWDLRTGKVLECLSGHTGPISGLKFDPNGQILSSISWDGTVRLWEIWKRGIVKPEVLECGNGSGGIGGGATPLSMSWRPDGQRLAIGTSNGTVMIWEMEDNTLEKAMDLGREIKGGNGGSKLEEAKILSLSYSPDGEGIFVGGSFGWIGYWDLHSLALLKTFPFSPEAWRKHGGGSGGKDDNFIDKNATRRENIAFSLHPSGRSFACLVGTLGSNGIKETTMQIWSLGEDLMLDKVEMELSITPQQILLDLKEGLSLKALLSSLSLGDRVLSERVLLGIDSKEIGLLIPLISYKYLPTLLTLANRLLKDASGAGAGAGGIRIELLLSWIRSILFFNGRQARTSKGRSLISGQLKDILSTLTSLYAPLSLLANENIFIMRGILDDC